MMFQKRFFKYLGEETKTRDDYGVRVVGGHNTPDAPDHISTFDPDFGDQLIISAETGVNSGDWEEVTEEEHEQL